MCGVIGILSTKNENMASYIYDALTIIQHRGQDAAGIVTVDNGRFYMRKANGLVRNVFRTKHMLNLVGSYGIGHIRYPTAGSSSRAEAQPFYVNSPCGIALAHNGNLTNTHKLAKELLSKDMRHINTDSDSEIILNILANAISEQSNKQEPKNIIFNAVAKMNERIKGGYACVSIIASYGVMFGFRDPNGIRPLIIGKKQTKDGTRYMLASESVAITALGYKIMRDVLPGEAVIINQQGELFNKICAKNTKYSPCIFEFVYFARPDSIIDEISVYKSRLRMGEMLAKQIQEKWQNETIDVVIPIPDTSRTSALQLASKLKIKYREGFIKNRYIARTFIMPEQKQRKKSVRQKLSAIALEFKGKNVLLVDDSIVRGTTSKEIVQMARDAGAKKVFFASASPPIRYNNVYGIDMASRQEFIAYGLNEVEICQKIAADKLIYQKLDDLILSVKKGNASIDEFDTSCFSGNYVTNDIDEKYLAKLEKSRNNKTIPNGNEYNLACNELENQS